MIKFFYSIRSIYMTTYAQRLARRTRNTFKPATTFFKKVSTEAPGFFKKVDSGAKTFFTKQLPSAGRAIGRGLEQVGGTISKVADSPLATGLTAAFAPEYMSQLNKVGQFGQGIRDSGSLVRQTSDIGKNLSRDSDTAQRQILERVKSIDSNGNKISYQ